MQTAMGIDVLIPARRDMDIYEDVVGLAKAGALDFKHWVQQPPPGKPVPLHRPEAIRKREEARQRTLAQRKAKADADAKTSTSSEVLFRSEVAVVAGLKTFASCPGPIGCHRKQGSRCRWQRGLLGTAFHLTSCRSYTWPPGLRIAYHHRRAASPTKVLLRP